MLFKTKDGFYRDGFCRTDNHDYGRHVVCAIMTQEFLEYTASRGNDLSTPNPFLIFLGLNLEINGVCVLCDG